MKYTRMQSYYEKAYIAVAPTATVAMGFSRGEDWNARLRNLILQGLSIA